MNSRSVSPSATDPPSPTPLLQSEGKTAGTPNRFDRRKGRTQAALQAAVLALILEKGYDAISVQNITDRADLGRGTFYLYYQDKEELTWNALVKGFEALDQQMQIVYAGVQSPELEYRMWLGMFEYADQHRDLFRVLLSGKGSAAILARFTAYIAQHVETRTAAGDFFPHYVAFGLSPYAIAQFVTGALTRMLTWYSEDGGDRTPADMAGMMHHLVFQRPPHGDKA